MANPIPIESLVPGGILPTDFLHKKTYDETCSRCRKTILEEVPLLLWINGGQDLYSYCSKCCALADPERDLSHVIYKVRRKIQGGLGA